MTAGEWSLQHRNHTFQQLHCTAVPLRSRCQLVCYSTTTGGGARGGVTACCFKRTQNKITNRSRIRPTSQYFWGLGKREITIIAERVHSRCLSLSAYG